MCPVPDRPVPDRPRTPPGDPGADTADTSATAGAADVWQAAVQEAALPVPYRPAPVAVPASPRTVVASPVRVVLAGADVALDTVLAALGATDPRVRRAGDAVLGIAWSGSRVTGRVAGLLARPVRPLARVAVDPPLVPRPLRLVTLTDRAAAAWREQRGVGRQELGRAWDTTVPQVVDVAVAPIDLTALVLDDVQLDVVARSVLNRLDLTDIVLSEVDLQRVAEAVLDRLDLTSVARERIDLAELAEEVIDAVDLPEIIRESTGSVASESVRSVRMQSIHADDRVQELVDRVLRWRKQRNTEAPAGSAQSDDGPLP